MDNNISDMSSSDGNSYLSVSENHSWAQKDFERICDHIKSRCGPSVHDEIRRLHEGRVSGSLDASAFFVKCAQQLRLAPRLFVDMTKALLSELETICVVEDQKIQYLLIFDGRYSGTVYLISTSEASAGRDLMHTFKSSEIGSIAHRIDAEAYVDRLAKPQAKILLELLFRDGENPTMQDNHRRECRSLARSITKKHGVLPASFYIHDVVNESTDPVALGGFADIHLGMRDDKRVCLKVLRLSQANRDVVLKDFCREALVWMRVKHYTIVPLLGVSVHLYPYKFSLISPWMNNGNIMAYIKQNPDHDLMRVATDIAAGIAYLHNHRSRIVHGDIKGANVLVADDGRCCLADFGISLSTSSESFHSTSGHRQGSLRWMAPELMDGTMTQLERAHPSLDIYSFACTIYEVFSGHPPFHHLVDSAVVNAIMKGERPADPQIPNLPEEMWNFIEICWRQAPALRPTIDGIVLLLRSYIQYGTFDYAATPSIYVNGSEKDIPGINSAALTNRLATSSPLGGSTVTSARTARIGDRWSKVKSAVLSGVFSRS